MIFNQRHYLLFCLLVFSPFSYAATSAPDNALDKLIELFQSQTQRWEPIIQQNIWGLFAGLVTITFTWNAIQILLKQGGIVDAIVLLFQSAMTIGMSVYIIKNASYLAWSLIGSFNKIAGILAGSNAPFSPSNIFELGLSICSTMIDHVSSWQIGDAIVMGLSALIILILFAMIAAEMTVLIIGSFMLVSGGTIMLGFLGSQWTRDYGMNYLTSVIGIGIQLFMMQLVVILGYGVFTQYISTGNQDSAASLILLGLTIVYYALIRTIPGLATSLASGHFRFASGGAVAAAASVAGAVAGAGLLAFSGGGSAVSTAINKFIGSDAGKSMMSKFTGAAKTAANYSPSTFAAMKTASVAGKAMSGAASVGGKVAKAGIQALANQSPVGRALSQASSGSGGLSHGHKAIKAAMSEANSQHSAPSFSSAKQNQSMRDIGKAMMNEL